MIINDGLIEERSGLVGGTQRIYRFGEYGLSLVNSPALHSFPFAWEAAVIHFDEKDDWELTYDTELTYDVKVFGSDKETNEFITKAKNLFCSES